MMEANPYIHNHTNLTYPCKACVFEEGFKAGEHLALEKQGQAYLEGKAEGKRELMREIAPIIEIALSSLKYCEEKYQHDNMTRLNIESSWQALKEVLGEERRANLEVDKE